MKRLLSFAVVCHLLWAAAIAYPAATVTTRAAKGSALTIAEMDANLISLRDTANDAQTRGTDAQGRFTLPGWTAPTLLNGWTNYGEGHNSAGYYKDAYGIVHLRGLIKSGTIPAIVLTLPTGYRPAANEIYAVVSNNALGKVTIRADGDVVVDVGNNTFLSLDGITFRAA